MTNNEMNYFYVWCDMLLFYGSLPKQIVVHQHPVIQVIIGVDKSFRKRENREWVNYRSLIVAPNQSHECDAAGEKIFSLNIDPESILGISLSKKFLSESTSSTIDQVVSKMDFNLFEKFIRDQNSEELLNYIYQSFFSENKEKNQYQKDDRIVAAKKYIENNLDKQISTNDLCHLTNLSESRFLHLFKEEMGLPVRNFILWTRLRKVISIIISGESLTYAAHEAGFSDSSHMSKTFVKAFGLNPATVIKNSKFVQVSVPAMI